MAKDTITLALNGEVTIRHFAAAVSSLEALVQALSKDLGVVDRVQWIIHDLQTGSAIATIRGESDILAEVEQIVDAYASVGQSLEAGRRPDFSEPVVRAASAITNVLDDQVTSMRFETSDLDVTISSHPDITVPIVIKKSYGALEGIVQTLSNRKGLRFNLFDILHDRAVSCYVQEGKEELMREIWGKRVVVDGDISREVVTGRPLAVRRIVNIQVLSEVAKGNYLKARNIAPRALGVPRAEEIIRRLRDA